MRQPLVLICLAALALAACATRYVAPNKTERSVFSQPVQVDAVRAAIIDVLNAHRYRIEREDAGSITTTLGGGGRELTLRVDYRADGFDISPVDMVGFETEDTPHGPRVSDRYVVWMRRLRIQVDRQLAELREDAIEAREEADMRALRVAQANEQAEQAALERERLARTPSYSAAPGGTGYVASPLAAGFNITRPPNGLGGASVVVVNQSAEALHVFTLRQKGQGAWLQNQLSRTIEPGQSFTLTGIERGVWEVRVETLRAFKAWGDLSFGSGGEYTLLVSTDGWTWL